MGVMDLMAEVAALLRARNDLRLSEAEIQLVASVVAGFASSPPDVRLAVAPMMRDVAQAALGIMRGRSGGPARGNGGLSN